MDGTIVAINEGDFIRWGYKCSFFLFVTLTNAIATSSSLIFLILSFMLNSCML
jgi:hypothetical protein